MQTNQIYSYNKKTKLLNGIFQLITLFLILSIILSYVFYFKRLELLKGTFIEQIVSFIKTQIFSYSYFGMFLVAIIGGIFFMPLPLEVIFATYLVKNSNTFAITVCYILGMIIGYSIDYFLGFRFSKFSKKLISVKKFYRLKVLINKHGRYAVFLFNVFPLPSQLVTFILGVFKYNKTRFYIQFLLGQIIKISVIICLVLFFNIRF